MVLSAIVDISSRKRLEERFRQVVESAPNAMVMINARGLIEMVNTQAERVFGFTRAEMLGQSIEILVPERFRANHPGLRSSFFTKPESRPMGVGRDLYGLKKDGSEFPIEIGLNPIETDEGTMVLSAIVDISSRKRLEERFRQVVESAPNAMVMINAHGLIEMVNAQAEKVFGFARAEMLGQSIEILVPERFRENHPGLRNSFFGKPESRPMGVGRDLYGLKKDGSEFPDRDRPQPDRDRRRHHGALGDRRHLVTQATRRTVSPGRRIGAERDGDDQRAWVDRNGQHPGRACVRLHARRDAGSVHRDPGAGALSRRTIQALRSSFFNNPESRPMGVGRDLYGLKKDGSEFPIEIGLNPIETDEGTMVLSAIVDISSRKRLEERFRQVVESAPNAMVMIGVNGKIEMVNAQAERVFGFARAEMLGESIEMLVPERFRKNHPNLRGSFFRGPEPRPMGAGRDLYGLRKDGSEFPVEIGLNPIVTDSGTMVLSAIVDISDRKHKEESIHAALKEKDILLGEIHHRVKNNLQIVHSLLDLQSTSLTDPAAVGLMRESQNRIRSMALIHQTLYESKDFARVDFGRFLDTLVPTLVSSYGVVSANLALSIEASEVQLPINAAIPCGLIVNELISNALKHAFPKARGGEITIRLGYESPQRVQLTVSDDGVGIPPEFEIVSATSLGLQLVTLLVDQLAGELSVQRVNPTRFAITFPIAFA